SSCDCLRCSLHLHPFPTRRSSDLCLLSEFVLTMMFLFVIMGATHGKAPVGFAPLAIGLALTLIHLISIHVTNTSVNPARSTGPRSEEHTSELQSREISYAVFCLKK